MFFFDPLNKLLTPILENPQDQKNVAESWKAEGSAGPGDHGTGEAPGGHRTRRDHFEAKPFEGWPLATPFPTKTNPKPYMNKTLNQNPKCPKQPWSKRPESPIQRRLEEAGIGGQLPTLHSSRCEGREKGSFLPRDF